VDEFYTEARKRMVQEQIKARGISDERVLAAMLKIPRHLFVDKSLWDQAYNDYPLPIGEGQTISQPYIVALMTASLRLKGEEKVLEIGTGSGYQTAILAELAREVYTIERIDSLLTKAKEVLNQLGYLNVFYAIKDGTLGWPEAAPFQAILVSAAAPDIPSPYVEQLDEGGHLVIPVGSRYAQTLYQIIKQSNGSIEKVDLGGCRFVPLIGKFGWEE